MTTQQDLIARTDSQLKAPVVFKQLATPTGFTPQAVQAISEALNLLIADAFALYIKTKNFHWHLSGPHFRDYHLLFDEQADQIFASTDPVAERVRRVGGTTVRSISHISRLQTIQDDNEELVPAGEMVLRLLEDNKHLVRSLRAAHEVCNKHQDVASASLLETIIDETERRIWFLFEVYQSLDDSH